MICNSQISIPRANGAGAKDRITVPCGKCIHCLQKKRADWTFRISQELKDCKTAQFLTLTYESERVELHKPDLQNFIKRIRDHQKRFLGKLVLSYQNNQKMAQMAGEWPKIRYYAVGEYGELTKRPHYHGIFFNIHPEVIKQLDKIWGLGFIMAGKVEQASIHYVTKYVINKQLDYGDIEKPFALMSLKPPIGHSYIKRTQKYHKENLETRVKTQAGNYQRMPRFYREKMFNDFEKEQIQQVSQAKADTDFKKEVQKIGIKRYLDNQTEKYKQTTERIKMRLDKKNKL